MIIKRKYTKITCKTCNKELKVRNDSIKKHTGYCQSCRKKLDWESEEYRKKCSDSHKGKPNNNTKPFGESSFNNLFYSYKKSAEKRGINFELTKQDFRKITKENCYYCGCVPSQKHGNFPSNHFNGFWVYNGVDRLNDSDGYVLGNIVPACKKCNYAKQGLTEVEFFELVTKIYKKHHHEVDTIGSRQIATK